MVCKKVLRQLSDYLGGELDPGLALRLIKHLDHCDDCRIVVDTTRKTIEVCCNTDPLPLPPDVQRRLDRALAERLRRKA